MRNLQAIGSGFFTDSEGREVMVRAGEFYLDTSEAVAKCPSCFNTEVHA